MITTINPGRKAINPPAKRLLPGYRLRGYISTLYLVDYGDRLLLLDCGSASDVGLLVDW